MGISPDRALADLDAPLTTAGFGSIAKACAAGRADLVGRGLDDQGGKRLRLFSTWEITKYLIPVAPAHFRRVLRGHPELPQGRSETEGGAPSSARRGRRRRTTCPTGRRGCRPR
jgi:chromosome partitioning protein